MNAYPFAGRQALVTGGTKGMGEAIVRRLVRDGATVIATARRRPQAPLPSVRYLEADVGRRTGRLMWPIPWSANSATSTSWSITLAARPRPGEARSH